MQFDGSDLTRLTAAITFVIAEALFCVAVSFCYSTGLIHSTSALGLVGVSIALLPITLIPLPASSSMPTNLAQPLVALEEGSPAQLPDSAAKVAAAAAPPAVPRGVLFNVAVHGLDFWLLFVMQVSLRDTCTHTRTCVFLPCQGCPHPTRSRTRERGVY